MLNYASEFSSHYFLFLWFSEGPQANTEYLLCRLEQLELNTRIGVARQSDFTTWRLKRIVYEFGAKGFLSNMPKKAKKGKVSKGKKER